MTSDGRRGGSALVVGAHARIGAELRVATPGYMEMLTGRRDTGCTNNACGDVPFSTIADDVADHGGTAAVIASWPGILHAATSTRERVATSIGRHGGDDDAFKADPNVAALLARTASPPDHGPGEDDFRLDTSTGELACAYLEARRPAFLFVGLGRSRTNMRIRAIIELT